MQKQMNYCIKITMRKKKFENAIKKRKKKNINIRTYTRTHVIIKMR